MDITLLVLAAILVVGYLAAIAGGIYVTVRKMASSPAVQRRPDLAPAMIAALPPSVADFLRSQDFQFIEAYSFHQVRLAIWEQPGGHLPWRRFMLLETAAKKTYQWVTSFSDNASLETGRERSSFLFPRLFGDFIQCAPGRSVEELWDLHVRGEKFAIEEMKLPVEPCRIPFHEGFRRGVIDQLLYVQSVPLWPLRGIYWFIVKRFLMQNRPIWKQNIARIYKPRPVSPSRQAEKVGS